MPPYTTETSRKHNKASRKSPTAQRAFAHAAESADKRGLSEGAAIRIGNFAADQSLAKSKRKK
jgi:hypothetical protein